MKDVKDLTVLVYGHGLEVAIAQRMARECKRVIYFSEWQEGFSIIQKAVVGDGFDNLERCEDIWDVKKDVDLFMFPDIQHAGLQLELESQGYPVWGSRRADLLEIDREFFLSTLEKVGLELPEWQVCVGVTELREYLRHRENVFIKVSRFRGTIETKKFRNWDLDANLVDLWALKLGLLREQFRFLVFDPIETPLEIGGDTYTVDGQWPALMLHGIEWKDKAYFSAVTARNRMPEAVQEVLEALTPFFERKRARNQWSMEIRVKGNRNYFIDATPRLGLPSTASQLEAWSNFPTIAWAGAHGILVEPEPAAHYTGELNLSVSGEEMIWPAVEMPTEIEQWVKLANCCHDRGIVSFPTEVADNEHVGWLVAIAESPREVLEKLKDYQSKLPEGLDCDITPMADVIDEIEQEEKKGIEFTDEPMPQPEEVLE